MKTTKLKSTEKGRTRGTPGVPPSPALPRRVARRPHCGAAAGAGPGLPQAAATLCPSLRDQRLPGSCDASKSAETGSFTKRGLISVPSEAPVLATIPGSATMTPKNLAWRLKDAHPGQILLLLPLVPNLGTGGMDLTEIFNSQVHLDWFLQFF